MTRTAAAPLLSPAEAEIVRRFDNAPCGLLEDGERYTVVRVRRDGSRAPSAAKRTLRGAIATAEALHQVTDARYLVVDPDNRTLHDTTADEESS